MDPLRCAVIGIHGYGAVHLGAIELLENEGILRLQAVSSRSAGRPCEELDELRSRGVHVYGDYRKMLEDESGLNIVSIPAPIHVHVPMALACFERGLHVLLEKPPAVLVQDVDRMAEAAGKCGCLCQVGFQSVADPAAVELKRRLSAGDVGRQRELVVRGLWRRTDGYYARTDWAGKLRVGGEWVLDGPMNNPLCHYIHQALFFAGRGDWETARPLTARAELYHARAIEGEDIVCARAELEGGAVLSTYLTLCASEHLPPAVSIVGERGTAFWTPGRYELTCEQGKVERSFPAVGSAALFRNLALAVAGKDRLCSPLAATRNVILHNNGCFKSSGSIRPVPPDRVRCYPSEREGEEGEVATEVDGLSTLMERAAQERRLFTEMEVEWAVGTPTVALDFDAFDPASLLSGTGAQ